MLARVLDWFDHKLATATEAQGYGVTLVLNGFGAALVIAAYHAYMLSGQIGTYEIGLFYGNFFVVHVGLVVMLSIYGSLGWHFVDGIKGEYTKSALTFGTSTQTWPVLLLTPMSAFMVLHPYALTAWSDAPFAFEDLGDMGQVAFVLVVIATVVVAMHQLFSHGAASERTPMDYAASLAIVLAVAITLVATVTTGLHAAVNDKAPLIGYLAKLSGMILVASAPVFVMHAWLWWRQASTGEVPSQRSTR